MQIAKLFIKFRIGVPTSVWLLHSNMVIDPRANHPRHWRFHIEYTYYDGIKIAILTRLNDLEVTWDIGEEDEFTNYCEVRYFHTDIYNSPPDFNSTTYEYTGRLDEKAPLETTLLLIKKNVGVIRDSAFVNCRSIRRCIMDDNVTIIRPSAFKGCSGLKVVRLSKGLREIHDGAFDSCCSLDALFLAPGNVDLIDKHAFIYCKNIRILPLNKLKYTSESTLKHSLGKRILEGCQTFFHLTQIQGYNNEEEAPNDLQVHQAIIDFYNNLPPLHSVCLDTNVNAKTIHSCIATHGLQVASIIDHDGMTPLHILAMNPHADIEAFIACYNHYMGAAHIRDNRETTPLEYLKEYNIFGERIAQILFQH